jgi:antitoxin component of MazEF toxin-antitoxin module
LSGENSPKIPERSAQPTEIQKGDTMPIFKKSDEGFLAKLFKHKQVEELAEELAHTYADVMQEELHSESDEPSVTEDTAAEQIPMLKVTETGEVDFTEPLENAEGESPPQDTADSTEPSEVRRHLITFRVNDAELEAINRRYAETSFRSRGDFCRYSALTVMNVEEDSEDIKQIAQYISSISNSFNQVAHRINKGGKLYDEDIADMKARLDIVWQLLVSIRSTRERTTQLLISATQTKPQTANMLLATCAYLLHLEHQNNSEISEKQSAQDGAEMPPST